MLRGKRALMEPITSMDGDHSTTTPAYDAATVERITMRILTRPNAGKLLDAFTLLVSDPAVNLVQICQIIFKKEIAKRPLSNAAHKILADAIATRNKPNQFIQFFNDHEKYAAANYQLALLHRNCFDGNPEYSKHQALAALAKALKKNYSAALEVSERAKEKVLARDAEQPALHTAEPSVAPVQALSKRRRFPILGAVAAESKDGENQDEETISAVQKFTMTVKPPVEHIATLPRAQSDASARLAQTEETPIPRGANLLERLADGEQLIGMSLLRFPSDLLPALDLDGYQSTLFTGFKPAPLASELTAEAAASPVGSESLDSYAGSSDLNSEELVPSEELVDEFIDETWAGFTNHSA